MHARKYLPQPNSFNGSLLTTAHHFTHRSCVPAVPVKVPQMVITKLSRPKQDVFSRFSRILFLDPANHSLWF